MDKIKKIDKNYLIVSLMILLIPVLWIIGLKFLLLQITATLLLIFNIRYIRYIKIDKLMKFALGGMSIFIVANLIAIVINPLGFEFIEFTSTFYHISYWVSGAIIIVFLYNSKINKEEVGFLCKCIFLLGLVQVVVYLVASIQWGFGVRWSSTEAILFQWLPDSLKIDFLRESMAINIAVEDPVKNELFFRFNGFYVYPVAAGLGSIYLLTTACLYKANLKWKKILKAVVIIGLIACVFYSKSRMVYLAPVVAIFITMVLYVINNKNLKKIMIILLGISILGSIVLVSSDTLSEIIQSRPESSSDRFNQYLYALKTVVENPIFGVGDKFSIEGVYLLIGSHSAYINALVRSGIVGFIGIIVFLSCVVIKIYKNKQSIRTRTTYKIWVVSTFLFLTNIIWMLTEEIDWPQIVAFAFFINIAIIFKFDNLANLFKNNNPKMSFVTSSGGHLTHLVQLHEWWQNKDRFWVTFKKTDAESILKDEKVYWCYYPTNRNFKNLIKNTYLAIKVLINEKPDVIISTGAAAAIPFYYFGKVFGCKLIYIEVYDRIDSPTVTGRIVYPICDIFIVQWEEQKKFYPDAELLGGLF